MKQRVLLKRLAIKPESKPKKQSFISMESRDDFRSIMPFLPLILRSSAVFWPPEVVKALKSLSKGPIHSNVDTGQMFAFAFEDMRDSLGIDPLRSSVSQGFSVYFDDLMSTVDRFKWFEEVVPRLADLMLRLPSLLETHYQNAGTFDGIETGLRLLESQQAGIVILSQELIAALLACALFCLFPTIDRGATLLPSINFDYLFLCLYERHDVKQEHKIKCILHYFERICSDMPLGNVSFERKVLHLENCPSNIIYPDADFWSRATISLCPLEVHTCGVIEDQPKEALEVDFANKSIGGGALKSGCVQEEIRFMINPELIISRLFLPQMADNEAIEIVGAERFSNYSGYASSFRFVGDHHDQKSVDTMGRRRTRITAIDALSGPGKRQYSLECLVRETSKAYIGFFDQFKSQKHQTREEAPSTSSEADGEIGVATGNWGCGAFGGDPQVKAVIQWIAASQAERPFILYYTFGLEALQKLELVVEWIVSQQWSVGEVWDILVDYSTQRLKKQTKLSFFNWLVPSLYHDDPVVLDVQQ